MVLNQQLLANFGLTVILTLGVLSAPSLQVKTEARVDSGTPYTTLEEACLDSAPGILLPPPVQYPLLPEAVTQEWRFYVVDSVPVPLSGSELKAHLIVNPSSECPVSRLCTPYLT
jgi:hypothetical protein